MIGRDEKDIYEDDKYFIEISNWHLDEIKMNYLTYGLVLGLGVAAVATFAVSYFV